MVPHHGDGSLAVPGVDHNDVSEGRIVRVLQVINLCFHRLLDCVQDRAVQRMPNHLFLFEFRDSELQIAPKNLCYVLELISRDTSKVALQGLSKHFRVCDIFVIALELAEAAEEVHKVTHVEELLHGRNLVCVLFLLF